MIHPPRWTLTLLFLAFSLPLAAAPKKPDWVTGPDPKYPETKYVTGVGIGADLDAARSNARAEIARTFQARVQQTLTDQQTESSSSVGKRRSAAQGTQKSEINTQLTTDTLLEGVAIVETYFDKKSKKSYALAVLDKVALRKTLSTQIMEKEHDLSAAKARADAATTPLERARALSLALEAARERDALSARRRVVDPAGMAELLGGTTAEWQSSLDKAIAAIPVSVQAEAPEGSKLREVVVAQINGVGVSISNASETGLAVKAKLSVAPFERNVPDWTFFQWSGTVELTDLATGKVVASASPDGVEGHLTVNTARAKTLAAGEIALGQEAAKFLSAHLFGQ
ncbi:MAG: LPP20 family lipoprotein [Elusimicrobia bacterium]|nr:LPP20 family lipoprotein [Elusimicrobiota bacterium]